MLQAPQGRAFSRLVFLLIGTAIGVALLLLLFRSVDVGQLGNAFARARYGYLLVAILPWMVNVGLKVPRWALLYGSEAPGWDMLFGAMNVGYAVNTLLPARLGEIVRAYWVRDRAGVPMVQTLSTIALERVTDGVALLLLLVVTAPTVAFPKKLLTPALTVGAVFIAVLIAMAVLSLGSSREDSRVFQLLRALEHGRFSLAGTLVRNTLAGLQALRTRRAILLLTLYTLLIWAANVALAWLTLQAFAIDVPLTGIILLTAVLNLGMAVPSSPGYVGVYEYLMVLTLSLYGIAHTPAIAAAFAFHAISFVPVTLIGLAYIARYGFETTLNMVRSGAGERVRPGV